MWICILCVRRFVNKRVYNSDGICDSSGRRFIISHILSYDGIYYISIQFSELKVSTRAKRPTIPSKKCVKMCSFYSIRLLVVAVYLLLMIRENRVIWLSGHTSSQNSHFHFCFFLVCAVCALCIQCKVTNKLFYSLVGMDENTVCDNHKWNAPATTTTNK